MIIYPSFLAPAVLPPRCFHAKIVIHLKHQPGVQIAIITNVGRNTYTPLLAETFVNIPSVLKSVFIRHKPAAILPVGQDAGIGGRGNTSVKVL